MKEMASSRASVYNSRESFCVYKEDEADVLMLLASWVMKTK